MQSGGWFFLVFFMRVGADGESASEVFAGRKICAFRSFALNMREQKRGTTASRAA
jgi:hypothetical protein